MKTVITIAGFDPSSGAGVTADLMVFAAHGLFGTSCITALTVQSTLGVASMQPVDGDIVRATLECLQSDIPPAGIKIGMLGDGTNARVISDHLEILKVAVAGGQQAIVVLDPVLRSSSGRELVDAAGLQALRERLIPLVDWVTPNANELAWLTGRPVTTREQLRDAALAFQAQGGRRASSARVGVLAKGGHLETPDDFLLTPEGGELWVSGEWIETRSTHGTGCALSSAFLSRLVLGDSAEDAAKAAKEYVATAMRSATPIGHGWGPMNHLWPLRRAGAV